MMALRFAELLAVLIRTITKPSFVLKLVSLQGCLFWTEMEMFQAKQVIWIDYDCLQKVGLAKIDITTH